MALLLITVNFLVLRCEAHSRIKSGVRTSA